MNTYYTGLFAEWLAKMFLRLHGYRILKSRYVTGKNTNRAEIDIIAKHKNVIVFIEVKCRPNLQTALDSVTPPQIKRLRNAASTYLIKTHWDGDARFDIIAVCGYKIHWAKNAF